MSDELSPRDIARLAAIEEMNAALASGDQKALQIAAEKVHDAETFKDQLAPDGLAATDAGNASRLLKYSEGKLKYVPEWKSWVVYKDGRWVRDLGDIAVNGLAREVSKHIFVEFAALEAKPRQIMFEIAHKFETTSCVRNMLTPAKSLPGILATPDDFDVRPELFNCVNGTVDLNTGELHEHDPADMLMKQSPVSFDPTAEAPKWEQAIREWMPDKDDALFLQQVLGTSISGYPETLILVNVGGGANGKSVCFNTLEHVLGTEEVGYAAVADNSLFVKTRNGNFQASVAKLYRARLAVGSETESGDKLEEAQMKTITGGDRINCRPLYQNPWSFNPTHTLVLHTNYLPNVRNQDAGMWRRLMVLKWRATFLPAAPNTECKIQPNPNLTADLRTESSGILNWLIAGYQRHVELGRKIIQSPNVIKDSQDYRDEEDHLGQFMTDYCIVTNDPADKVLQSEFREAYLPWCQLNGIQPWSDKALGMQMQAKGFDAFRITKGRGRSGFKLKPAHERDEMFKDLVFVE